MAEGSENYRAELAKEILQEPDKEKRRDILEQAKKTQKYVMSLWEHKLPEKEHEVFEALPSGWYTLQKLINELGAKDSILKPIIYSFASKNPQLIGKYVNKYAVNKVNECYSYELTAYLFT